MQKFYYCEKYGGRVEACSCDECKEWMRKWHLDFKMQFADNEKLCYHQIEPSIWSDGRVENFVHCVKCNHGLGLGT